MYLFSGQKQRPNEKVVSDSVTKLSDAFVDLFGGDLNRVSECLKEAMFVFIIIFN